MNALKTTQGKFTALAIVFFVVLVATTLAVIRIFVTPDLKRLESAVVDNAVNDISVKISSQLRQVEAQSRSITQTVALLDSDSIDKLQPGLVDQYGDPNVFGGGIWPLPNKRLEGRDKFSTFFARDASNMLVVNTHWNSAESLKYWEQPWYDNGVKAAKGHCNWAKAYQDAASPQPRTNCAMPIYKGDALWGVSTIDVTLGFFNRLVSDMESVVRGQILIVERDGKIVSNSSLIKDNIVLKHVSEIASTSPMAAELARALPQLRDQAMTESEFREGGESHTMFLKPIPGSPWVLATNVPTALLAQNSDRILGRLGMVQVPLALLLLGLVIGSIRVLMNRLGLLKTNIDALSAGNADLTRRLPATGGGAEFDAVAASFNAFIARLQKLMQQIVGSSEALNASVREIAEGNVNISSRTESQASSIEETAASMEELTGTVKQNADNADRANKLAVEASAVAVSGGEVISQVVATMDSISKSSSKIADIISVIDGIAFQTNILALNAAVEAARAGEQGRGFAVVAAEVRSLAQRSAVAAKEIGGLIGDSVDQVSAGATLVGKAGSTIEEIMSSSTKVATIMREILAASREQQTGIEQVNQAITQLDSSTQQNAALMEQVAAAARGMEATTGALARSVGEFKLND